MLPVVSATRNDRYAKNISMQERGLTSVEGLFERLLSGQQLIRSTGARCEEDHRDTLAEEHCRLFGPAV